MELIQSANLAVRFLLELAALVAFGSWGYATGQGSMRFVLAIGLPLLAAVIWGVLVAPNAAVELPDVAKLVLGLVILGLAAAAFFGAGYRPVAVVYGVVVVVNAALMLVWHQ